MTSTAFAIGNGEVVSSILTGSTIWFSYTAVGVCGPLVSQQFAFSTCRIQHFPTLVLSSSLSM